jgi:transposase
VLPDINLSKLTIAEKDALILSLLPLTGRLEAALARIAELEARLARLEKPPKTPDNSSLPPSKGQKRDQPPDGTKPPRRSRPGFGRTLEPNPDRIVDRLLDTWPHCAAAWAAGPQTPQQVYDRVELPPIKPDAPRCGCSADVAPAAASAARNAAAGPVRVMAKRRWAPSAWITLPAITSKRRPQPHRPLHHARRHHG